MNREEVCARTMAFAVRVAKMADYLPRTPSGRNAAGQVVRSACSVAAIYRSAQRGKSKADFVAKITTVLEEADEADFWLEFITEAGLMGATRLTDLRREAGELVRIFAAMRRTARNHPS